MTKFVTIALMLALAGPAFGRAVKIVDPLPAEVTGHCKVVSTDVTLNEATKANFDKLEAKAAAKRTAAGLPTLDATSKSTGGRPSREQYSTLPIARMFPLVIEDEAAAWPLKGDRGVKLSVEFDTLKTANAGMAMLIGSTDQLAGTVNVADATTGEKLGSFYVDVLNARGGALGLAMRGSGVREKLAFEFAKRVVQTLGGSKHRPANK